MPLFFGEDKISQVAISVENADSSINTNDATLTSGGQMLSGVTAYSKGTKYTGTIATVEGPTPNISVSGSGLITASVSNLKGYQSSATTKTSTQQLTTQGIKVITPNDSVQTAVSAGVYTTAPTTVSAVPTETKSITSNGTYNPTNGKYFSSVTVNVAGDTFYTQTKSVTPTESKQTVTPDSGYNGLASVTVGAISSTYVGSAVPTQGAKTVTPSTSVQTAVSSGTYVTGDIKVSAMPAGILSTPTINTNTGLVTGGVTTSGYISNSATKTLQLNTKSAATITPTTTNQTINAGQYLTGAQIIQGDANLIPKNIASGVSIFGVTGTHQGGGGTDTSDATATQADIVNGKTAYINGGKVTGTLIVQNYYTGTTTPESTIGEDGDLYFKVVR